MPEHPAETVPDSSSPSGPGIRTERKGDPNFLGDRLRLVNGGAIEDREELLATVARDHVAATEPALENRGEFAQDHVARLMAVLLVELAEMIEVEDHDRRSLPVVARGTVAGGLEAGDRRVEIPPVEQPREGVADRQFGHVGVEEGVGDREGDEAREDRQGLELVGTEGPVEIEADQRQGADDHVVADERHGGTDDGFARDARGDRVGVRGPS